MIDDPPPAPARWGTAGPVVRTFGLQAPGVDHHEVAIEMHVPEAVRDSSGAMATGALAVLADSSLGLAIMQSAGDSAGMATSHLHLELLRPVPMHVAVLYCAGRLMERATPYAAAAGTIADAAGTEIVRATMGAILMERRGPGAQGRASEGTQPTRPTDVAGLLGTDVVAIDERGCSVRFVASEFLANSAQGVQGGVGVLMCEQAMSRALAEVDGAPHGRRMVELRAAFIRPVPATGDAVSCAARVLHVGRRTAQVRSELRDQHDRIAVLVDGTFVTT